MKKLLALLLAMVCLVSCALAEGVLTISGENLVELPDSDTGWYFAKIENTGDAAIGAGYGNLYAYAEDGTALFDTMAGPAPSYILLEPGAYAYVNEMFWEDAIETADIARCELVLETTDYPDVYQVLPCEAAFVLVEDDDSILEITYVNETGEIVYNLYMTAAMLDAEGKVLFVAEGTLYDVGVHPASGVTLRTEVEEELLAYYEANGVSVASVEAFAYIRR